MIDLTEQEGFTFIEVLVALTIFSISMAVLLNVFSDGFSRMALNEERSIEDSYAQSILAEVGTTKPLQLGETTGQLQGGYSWIIKAKPYGNENERAAWPVLPVVVSLSVRKEGQSHKSVELTTMKFMDRSNP